MRVTTIILLGLWFCLSLSEIKGIQAIGEIIRQEGRILTGSNSRVEVEFPSATVRIGSNSDLRYASDYREMSLNHGTLLLSARDDVVLYAGLLTMKTSRGDFQCSNIPGNRIKMIVLDGKVVVYFAGSHANLRYGEAMEIPCGATKMPRSIVIDLKKLFETSLLLKMGPLPNQWRLERNIHRQNPLPPPIANSPPGYEAAKTTATAGMASNIARQQAMFAASNEQVIADRRVQRLIDQGAPQSQIHQAEQQANQAAKVAGNPPTTPKPPPARPPAPAPPTRPDFGRPGRPDIGRPGFPGRGPIFPGPGGGGPIGPGPNPIPP